MGHRSSKGYISRETRFIYGMQKSIMGKGPLWDIKIHYGTRKSSMGNKNPLRDESSLRDTKIR